MSLSLRAKRGMKRKVERSCENLSLGSEDRKERDGMVIKTRREVGGNGRKKERRRDEMGKKDLLAYELNSNVLCTLFEFYRCKVNENLSQRKSFERNLHRIERRMAQVVEINDRLLAVIQTLEGEMSELKSENVSLLAAARKCIKSESIEPLKAMLKACVSDLGSDVESSSDVARAATQNGALNVSGKPRRTKRKRGILKSSEAGRSSVKREVVSTFNGRLRPRRRAAKRGALQTRKRLNKCKNVRVNGKARSEERACEVIEIDSGSDIGSAAIESVKTSKMGNNDKGSKRLEVPENGAPKDDDDNNTEDEENNSFTMADMMCTDMFPELGQELDSDRHTDIMLEALARAPESRDTCELTSVNFEGGNHARLKSVVENDVLGIAPSPAPDVLAAALGASEPIKIASSNSSKWDGPLEPYSAAEEDEQGMRILEQIFEGSTSSKEKVTRYFNKVPNQIISDTFSYGGWFGANDGAESTFIDMDSNEEFNPVNMQAFLDVFQTSRNGNGINLVADMLDILRTETRRRRTQIYPAKFTFRSDPICKLSEVLRHAGIVIECEDKSNGNKNKYAFVQRRPLGFVTVYQKEIWETEVLEGSSWTLRDFFENGTKFCHVTIPRNSNVPRETRIGIKLREARRNDCASILPLFGFLPVGSEEPELVCIHPFLLIYAIHFPPKHSSCAATMPEYATFTGERLSLEENKRTTRKNYNLR